MTLPRSLLVIVGDELLGGFTRDLNGALATRRLFEVGYPVGRIEIVGDSIDDIAAAVTRAIGDPGVARIVVCGGIGPTPDDRTHEGVARALGRELVENPRALSHIRALLERMHAAGWVASPEPSPANRRMAVMAAGALALDNPRGMAPPLALRLPGSADPAGAGTVSKKPLASTAAAPAERWLFVLPGVPREFAAILEEVLIPTYFTGSRALSVVEQRHRGAIEADFAGPLTRLGADYPDVTAGSYPEQGAEPVLVIRLRGEDPERVAAAAATLERLAGRTPGAAARGAAAEPRAAAPG
jgi:nicotinamide-nucleotide amidase